jgi:hypothetical protein
MDFRWFLNDSFDQNYTTILHYRFGSFTNFSSICFETPESHIGFLIFSCNCCITCDYNFFNRLNVLSLDFDYWVKS